MLEFFKEQGVRVHWCLFFFLRPLFSFLPRSLHVFLLLLAPSFLSGFTKSFVVVVPFFFFFFCAGGGVFFFFFFFFFFFCGAGGGAYLLSSYLISLVHWC